MQNRVGYGLAATLVATALVTAFFASECQQWARNCDACHERWAEKNSWYEDMLARSNNERDTIAWKRERALEAGEKLLQICRDYGIPDHVWDAYESMLAEAYGR